MKIKKKSPLKDRPLRTPGQSLDDEIQKILDDDVTNYALAPILMIAFTFWLWLLWYQVIKISNPWLFTVVTIAVTIFCIFRLIKIKKRLKALRLGRDGERAVGQVLEALRRKGYRVFHDLIGDKFNIDHVIVCEHGVFSVETKTYSKPEKGECKIVVDSEGVSVNGYKPEKKILIQAEAQKNWLEKQTVRLTGIKLSVKPVIVFPGWYVENRNAVNNIWVLEPKALPTYIKNAPRILTEEQVRLIANQLSSYIRTTYDNH